MATQAFEILRGTAEIAASSASATITESTDYTLPAGATINNCFIRITNTQHTGMGNNAAGGNQNDDDFSVRISNPSNLLTSINFTRVGTTNSCHVSYEIWCYVGSSGGANEVIVRDVGTVSGTAAQLTGTTITTITDNADCVVFITGQGSSNTGRADGHYRLWTASLVANASDWDPQFDRDSTATASTAHVSYAVVEFVGANWTIDRVESTTTGTAWTVSDNNSFTIAHGVTMSDVTKAGIIESQYSTSNDGTGLDDACDASYLDSTTNIRVWNRATAGTRRKVWWIAQNSQADGTARNLKVQHIEFRDDTTSGAEPRGWTETISTGADSGTGSALTAPTDETALVATTSMDGTGTAFPRGCIDYRLTGTDTITFRESDNGQERRTAFEIWEFPEDPVADTTISVPVATLTLTEQTPTVKDWVDPTAAADENANASLNVDTTYLIRVRVETTGGTDDATASFRWAYNHDSGGDTPITTSSTHVKAVNATTFANDDDTNELLGGSGTYVTPNSAATEDGTTTVDETLGNGEALEFVLAFQLDSANVANDETGTIRLEYGSGQDLFAYSQTFTYTVIEGGADVTVSVPLETLTLTEQTPTVIKTDDKPIDVPLETLTLTEGTPTVNATDDHIIAVPAETLTLTEQTPAVTATQSAAIPAETLTLTEFAPTVVQDYTAIIPAEALTVTEFAPTVVQDYTVQVPLDALTLTEFAPSIQQTTNINVPTEEITLTEFAPTVVQDQVVNVPTAELTLAEQTPVLHRTRRINVPTAEITLTEAAPTVNQDYTILVPVEELTLSEQTPTVLATDDHPIAVPADALTLTEAAPTVTQDYSIQVPAEALVLAEAAPTVVQTERVAVSIPAESLTLTEQTPTVNQDYTVLVPTAAVTLTEFDLTLQITTNISVPVEEITLTEFAPLVVQDHTILIPSETLTLVEQTPTVEATDDHPIDVPADALTLTEFAPTVTQDYTVLVPTAELTLSEQTPTVDATDDHPIDVPTDALTLSEQAPTVTRDWTISVPTAELAVTEYAPAVYQDVEEAVPTAALTLTTNAPTVNATDDHPIDVALETISLTAAAPTVNVTHNINVPLATVTLSEQTPTKVQTDHHVISIPGEGLVFDFSAPIIVHPQEWTEVPSEDDEVWAEVATADSETWTEVSTADSETWLEVATSDTEVWNEVTTNDAHEWEWKNR